MKSNKITQQISEKIAIKVNIAESKWRINNYITEDLIKEICIVAIADKKSFVQKKLEVSILLTNDKKILELNEKFRNAAKATNVLAFPNKMFIVDDICYNIGDLAISYDTIKIEAEQQNKKFEHHFTHMLLHGLLHLLEYDHQTNEEALIMEQKEIQLLQQFCISNPYVLGS